MSDEDHPDDLLGWLDEDRWWACREPERPSDGHVVYSEGCRWCLAKLRLDVGRDPELRADLREALDVHLDPSHDCAIPSDVVAAILA